MLMEVAETIKGFFLVGAFLLLIVAAAAIIGFFQKVTVTMTDSGSRATIAYKILGSYELSYHNAKNETQKFILNKSALDRYNNTDITDKLFDGSYYFVEIRNASRNVWRFSNADFKYAFNARLRGVLPADEDPSVIQFCSGTQKTYAGYASSLGSDPFSGMQPTAVTIVDKENVIAGQAYWLADPDSSYSVSGYTVKYPLCICDLACPTAQCKYSPDC